MLFACYLNLAVAKRLRNIYEIFTNFVYLRVRCSGKIPPPSFELHTCGGGISNLLFIILLFISFCGRSQIHQVSEMEMRSQNNFPLNLEDDDKRARSLILE
ncbi:MAG: hypothetical protein HC935_02790 [Pseudanabaena sp. SU_2_4]|nr:hypothetical protein [Pseudanabaena sp. SU_2_4]